jgi:hypothetical protein
MVDDEMVAAEEDRLEAAKAFSEELEKLCTRAGAGPDQAKLAVRVMAAMVPKPLDTANPNNPATTAGADDSAVLSPTSSSSKKGGDSAAAKKKKAEAAAARQAAALSAAAKAGHGTATRVIASLCSSRSLAPESKRLLATLKALREAAKSFPGEFAPHEEKVRQFVLEHVVLSPAPQSLAPSSPNSGGGEANDKKKKSGNNRSKYGDSSSSSSSASSRAPEISEDCARLCAGLKILAVILKKPAFVHTASSSSSAAGGNGEMSDDDEDSDNSDGEGDELSGGQTSEPPERAEQRAQLLDFLFGCLGGTAPGGRGRRLPADEQAQLRRVCSVAALNMCEMDPMCITPERWHLLGWTMQVENKRHFVWLVLDILLPFLLVPCSLK